jgi:L-lactate utilization protein LutB
LDANQDWWIEERMKRTIERLKAHDFEALYVKTKEEATQQILKHVRPETRVGAAGSVTIRQLGLLDSLRATGHVVYDRWVPGLTQEERLQLGKSQMSCDLFLCSVNAVTMTGELVNIDGSGNRVNGTIFGPGKVILVAGYNKIVTDMQTAMDRVKNVAAPINAKRLKVEVPCAKTGRCMDCDSPHRICRVTVIHERKPFDADVLIILVGEELGY